jgi:hypothetical protein
MTFLKRSAQSLPRRPFGPVRLDQQVNRCCKSLMNLEISRILPASCATTASFPQSGSSTVGPQPRNARQLAITFAFAGAVAGAEQTMW